VSDNFNKINVNTQIIRPEKKYKADPNNSGNTLYYVLSCKQKTRSVITVG
jgi:hypothetical protein